MNKSFCFTCTYNGLVMDEKQLNKNVFENLEEAISVALVPQFTNGEVRPCVEDDFQEYIKNLDNVLHHVITGLDNVLQNCDDTWMATKKGKKSLVQVLVIIGEQHYNSAWSTNSSVELSRQLIPKICKILKKDSIAKVLDEDYIFLSVVRFLRPELLKDTWKSYPAAVICYKWLLESVEKPTLRRHIPEILPTALIILDDYVQENQLYGLNCLTIIIEHCQRSRSLKNCNYDEVIFQALVKMMYKVEPGMIVPLYSCISSLLDNMEYCTEISDKHFTWTKRDDVLCILLDNMELESKVECRYAYAVSLKNFLKYSSSGKWTERLARVLSEYCENFCDLKTVNVSLDLLKTFLSVYRPCSLHFYTAIYSSLLKLALELKLKKNEELDTELDKKVHICIALLNEKCPNLSTEILNNDQIKLILKNL